MTLSPSRWFLFVSPRCCMHIQALGGQGILNHLNLTSGTEIFLCHPGNSELSLNPCEGNLLLVPLILWYKPSGFPTQRPEGLPGLPLLRPWAPIVVSQVPWGCLQTLLSVSFASSGVTNNPRTKAKPSAGAHHYGFPSSPRSCKAILHCVSSPVPSSRHFYSLLYLTSCPQ